LSGAWRGAGHRHNGSVRDAQLIELREAQSVERRLHTRHRARTVVYITVPGGRRKLCKAVNLSATGVFIETTNLGLRKGQQVILAFAINLGAVTKLHRRTAVVAHVSRGGTGLMMESYGAAARTSSTG
jgi:hypothetical protein